MVDFIDTLRTQLINELGVKESVLSDKAIESALLKRMEDLKVEDFELYYLKLQHDEEEWQKLLEHFLNTDTWFFRDPIVFDFLIDELIQNRKTTDFPLSILVAACSTGEEAYSILLKVLEKGYQLDDVLIEGYDISVRAVEKAKKGVFGKYSFRGKNVDFIYKYFKRINSYKPGKKSSIENQKDNTREVQKLPENNKESYFDHQSEKYLISENIKLSVQFFHANLLDSSFQPKLKFYDVIFCRNLLVYLDVQNQHKLLHRLSRLMHSKSVLFVSPSEIEIVRKYGLHGISYRNKMVYFVHKNTETLASPKKVKRKRLDKEGGQGALTHHSISSKYISPKKSPEADHPLDYIETLANEGFYSEAMEKCEKYLSAHQDSERAHFLLGVIKQALGKGCDAETQFKKAIYLNPKYRQALIFLSLLEEQKGEHQKAALLKQRADRCVE